MAIRLEEIWKQKFPHGKLPDYAREIALEFGKQLLELAAENAEIEERDYRKNPTKISNYGQEVCSEYEGIYYGVDKQSILDTINQVE